MIKPIIALLVFFITPLVFASERIINEFYFNGITSPKETMSCNRKLFDTTYPVEYFETKLDAQDFNLPDIFDPVLILVSPDRNCRAQKHILDSDMLEVEGKTSLREQHDMWKGSCYLYLSQTTEIDFPEIDDYMYGMQILKMTEVPVRYCSR